MYSYGASEGDRGQNLETGYLFRNYMAKISLNVTLNHNQHQINNVLLTDNICL